MRLAVLPLLLAFLLAAWPLSAFAGTASGDAFSVRLLVGGVEIASTTDVVGSGNLDLCAVPGSSCNPGSQHFLSWLDGDTVQIDWFDTTVPGPSSVVYELEGVDFVQGATGHGILGVTQAPTNFPPAAKLEISYTLNSIRFDYANLSSTDAGDGDIGTFDVETDADLADTYSIEVIEDGLSVGTTTHVRGQESQFTILSVPLGGEYKIEWLGEESFEIDWFTPSIQDIQILLTGLDFQSQARKPGSLDDVIKNSAPFPADPVVSFDASSITLDYMDLALAPFPESDDGDVRVFDLTTTIPEVDFYTVRIIEDGQSIGKSTSVRGLSDGYSLSGNYSFNWVDDDSFVIDWFSGPSTSLEWEISFRDLRDSFGEPARILAVTKSDSGFSDDPSFVFTDDSVTITYASLVDPGSGDFRQFDLTVPEPTVFVLLPAGGLALAGLGRRRMRRKAARS